MMAASAISGICNLAPPILPNHRERDLRKSREHDVLLNRMLKHGRCSEAIPELVHHLEQPNHSDMNFKFSSCSCGMESASSQFVSTSGQARRVLLATHTDSPPISCRKLQRKLSMKKIGKKSSIRVSALPCSRSVRSRDLSASFEKVAKQVRQRQQDASEKWGMDMHVDVTEEVSRRQKRRAALAALAVAGYVSILQPSSASTAEALRVDFPAPTTTVEVLEAQFKGSTRNELESEIQIHRNESGMTSIATTAPALSETQGSQITAATTKKEVPAGVAPSRTLLLGIDEDSFYAWKQVQKEIDMEADPFYAWKQATTDIRVVGGLTMQDIENDSFYAWKQVLKEAGIVPPPSVPKSPVKKAVAASVAVAVAGSVAGAASAAGRAVASSGGTSAVATSLTVLQHSALPGSTLLARIVQHLGGGGVAGAVGATVVYPLDTIKTRMQAQNMQGKEPQYKDEIDCFKQLVTKEGPASLYSGLVPQLLGIAPEKAMKLTVNEALLSSLEVMMPGARVWALEFIAGGGGGASQVVFTNPMEIVKVRLQTQREGQPKKALWTIVKELGVKGLYDGAGVTLARDVPSSAVFFAIYSLLRGLYPDQSFLAGAIAAIPATILVTPMDIIKTRLQKEPAPGEQQYTDWWECLQDIVTKEGPQALFKGSLLRVLRTSPQFGITLMIYGLLTEGGP
ncbi:hypothetical protein KC19_8G068800 [Ceratodon purpureus]|uniref:Uncharacterized protein n=1 Tax=Ceratodon purpureus TaxID=3225 RepID=A0A8T0GVY4_CERPU|nr:hypothetical protein KC19_8G068800 [Ceratodon purpureus]